MVFKQRNQNNVIMFKQGLENKQKIEAEERIKNIIYSIDEKMNKEFWDMLAFHDCELEVLANFGETIKFPTATTAARVASVLANFVLKQRQEEDFIDV